MTQHFETEDRRHKTPPVKPCKERARHDIRESKRVCKHDRDIASITAALGRLDMNDINKENTRY